MAESSVKNNIVNLEDFEALKNELEILKKSKEQEPTEKTQKTKKERTDKQKESFQRALEARKSKIEERSKLKEQLQEQAKKEAEEELIKKAIKYKKQQIKKIQVEIPLSKSEDEDEEEDDLQRINDSLKSYHPEIERKAPPPKLNKPKLERSSNKQIFPAPKEKSKFIYV